MKTNFFTLSSRRCIIRYSSYPPYPSLSLFTAMSPVILLGRISYSSPSSGLVLTFSLCKYLRICFSISKTYLRSKSVPLLLSFVILDNTLYNFHFLVKAK